MRYAHKNDDINLSLLQTINFPKMVTRLMCLFATSQYIMCNCSPRQNALKSASCHSHF